MGWREEQERRLFEALVGDVGRFIVKMLIGLTLICLIWGEWSF